MLCFSQPSACAARAASYRDLVLEPGNRPVAEEEEAGALAGLDDPELMNAGDTVDNTLFDHWARVPSIAIDADELERFGRSTSF